MCVCVSGCFCTCGVAWQSSRFEDHPKICCIPQGSWWKGPCTNMQGARTEKQNEGTRGGNIFSCVACVSAGSPLLKSLSPLPKLSLQGIWMNLCALQHLPTGSRRRKNTDLRFFLALPGVCVALFPEGYSPQKTIQASPLTPQNIVYCIIWSLCGAAANSFILPTKMNNFPFWHCATLCRVYRTHAVQYRQCSDDKLLFWGPSEPTTERHLLSAL